MTEENENREVIEETVEKNQENEIQTLRNLLDEKERDIKEHLTKLKYLQAECENIKKQCIKERGEYMKYANENLVKNLLPFIDSMELALSSPRQSNDVSALISGFEMIYNQIVNFLTKEGVSEIKTEGEKFDPFLHEAVDTVASDLLEGMIVEEYQKGYTYCGKVIRPSKVKVSVGSERSELPGIKTHDSGSLSRKEGENGENHRH